MPFALGFAGDFSLNGLSASKSAPSSLNVLKINCSSSALKLTSRRLVRHDDGASKVNLSATKLLRFFIALFEKILLRVPQS